MSGFVRVIPLCRTPVGVEAFDYRLPEDLELAPGDLVRVPLRTSTVEAVVLETLVSSPFAEKTRTLANQPPLTRLGTDWIQLLHWLAARTFQSGPTIAKAWLRLFPKKLSPWTTQPPNRTERGTVSTHWVTAPEQALIQFLKTLPANVRVLVITPYTSQAERIADALSIDTLLSDDPKTSATSTWRAFTEGTSHRLVTTRVGAWLGLYADHIVLLEPENDEHKQDELSPRFDARLVTAWLHQRLGTSITTFGRTPPLHVQAPAAALELHPELYVRHAQGQSQIPGISFDALEAFLEGEPSTPRTIIHPIRGLRVRAQCRDCGDVVSCPTCGSALRLRERDGWCDLCHHAHLLPECCSRCGGVNFSGSSAGIELLKKRWKDVGLPEIDWRDGSPLAIDTPFAIGSRVLVTQPALLGGAAEDVRRSERLCRAYRALVGRVQEAQGSLLLQVPESDTRRWLEWLTVDGVERFFTQERKDRHTFRYPPSVRLVKLLLAGTPEQTTTLTETIERTMKRSPLFLESRGPFPVEGRPTTRARSVVHLLFQPTTQEEALLSLLQPFAKRAVIDLDPIAFLR